MDPIYYLNGRLINQGEGPQVVTGHVRPRRTGARERRGPGTTRQALLRAGAQLFPGKGFDGVSVEDLAGRAGVNKALISYHFGGKRGLYVAVLESAFAEMADRLTAIEKEATDAREGLHRFLETFEALTRERRDFPALFLREAVSSGIEPAVVPHLVKIVGIVGRLAGRGVREGVFRPVDPILLHFGMVGSLAFFFATEPARRRAAAHLPFKPPSPQAFTRHIEEMTLRGLSPEPPATKKKPRKRKGARS
jgi:AcrR family transcriptional regulator